MLLLVAAAANPNVAPGVPMAIHIDYKLDPETVIGPVRAGMLCLPNGKLRWRDLRLPGLLDSQALVARALASGGMNVVTRDAGPSKRGGFINLAIETAHLRLCMPGLSGVVGKPRGEGNMRLHWQLSDSDGKPIGGAFISETPLSAAGEDPRRSTGMMERALLQGSDEFARYWRAHQSLPLP